MLRTCLLLALLLGASRAEAAAPIIDARAPDVLSQDEMAETIDFIVGNAVFALYHQAGHMMIERFGLDAREGERAADRFAAITLLEPRSGAGDQTLVDAIDSWKLASHEATSIGSPVPILPDRHALDEERAAAIVCDMIGADREGFGDIGDAAGLSAAKREACASAWRDQLQAFEAATKPLRRADGSPKPSLPTIYETADEQQAVEATILQDNRVLEEVAERLGETYGFAMPPTLRAKSCGEPTSMFDAGRNEIVLCYELSAYHSGLILRDIERR